MTITKDYTMTDKGAKERAKAFDAIQNLKWEASNWTNHPAPFEYFEQLINIKAFGTAELLAIAEALLVLKYAPTNKLEVKAYLNNLNELDELYNNNYEKYLERSKEVGIQLH